MGVPHFSSSIFFARIFPSQTIQRAWGSPIETPRSHLISEKNLPGASTATAQDPDAAFRRARSPTPPMRVGVRRKGGESSELSHEQIPCLIGEWLTYLLELNYLLVRDGYIGYIGYIIYIFSGYKLNDLLAYIKPLVNF